MKIEELCALLSTKRDAFNEEKAAEVSRGFLDFVNNLCFNQVNAAKAIAETKPASDLFAEISASWLAALRDQCEKQWFDARNAYSCTLGDRLMSIPEVGSFIESNRSSVGDSVCGFLQRGHRTLQQSFSGVVFAFIEKTLPSETIIAIERAGIEPEFARCPLI